jgi:hypothetical protein
VPARPMRSIRARQSDRRSGLAMTHRR